MQQHLFVTFFLFFCNQILFISLTLFSGGSIERKLKKKVISFFIFKVFRENVELFNLSIYIGDDCIQIEI